VGWPVDAAREQQHNGRHLLALQPLLALQQQQQQQQ
jgi:hypothetical protein